LAGRMFRKRTQPMLPGRQSFVYTASETVPSRLNIFTQTDDFDSSKKAKCDVSTQTEFATQVSKKTIRKFRDSEIDVTELTTEKFILY
jgi:hypothetical protein